MRLGDGMVQIGIRNLRRDPMRAMVAVCGVVFAVVLVTMEIGMLIGLVRDASLLIDRSRADIWVSSVDVQTFDFATPVSQRKKYLIRSVPGVEKVEEYNVSYSIWKLPTGGNANCQVIGFDPKGTLAAPLNMEKGRLDDIVNQDAVIIDEGERPKLGNPKIGDFVEIMQKRARVAGFTRGMRSFTTTPYVFTSLDRSRIYSWISSGTPEVHIGTETVYFLVKVAPGADVETVRRAIESSVADVEAHTRESLSWRTRRYWLVETGVGLGFLAAAFLGLLVGGVIVSQTLYAMTVEKLSEYGVLKALGATMGEISRVVLAQGLICGAAGLAMGLLASFALSVAAESAGATVVIPWPLAIGVTLLTAILCSGAAMVSIARLRKVDPAMVFRA